MFTMKNTSNLDIQLPPGFRFHPTDEELIVHYLHKKVSSTALPASIFAEIELYKFNPWELPYKALFGDDEWYFFSPRDRKYPNGLRPNRMAGSGYWKATGTDRPIVGSSGEKIIGVKKGLVFYKGRPPRGVKTDWIMHEYRLLNDAITCNSSKPKESMRLDDWVLCGVRQKTCIPRNLSEDGFGQRIPKPEKSMISPMGTNPTQEILKETILKDCPMLPFIFDSHLNFNSMDTHTTSSTISFEGSKNSSGSSENRGNFLESFEGSVSHDRKRKEWNRAEGFHDPNKKIRAMESRNTEAGSLEVDTNEIGQSDLWMYMMAYQDLNDLTFI